ncbi:MAG: DUF423 domain-containing protein [Planctomycetes bacterium]|nr:DUF423 domain-containing protein [Planctomycetota bacterium]
MSRTLLLLGAILGLTAVLAGTFGAHGLSQLNLDAHARDVYEIGVRYHMYHGLALIALAAVASRHPSALLDMIAYLFTGGVAVFSISLYALAITGIKWLGAITPLGGMCFLAGWVMLIVFAFRLPRAAA